MSMTSDTARSSAARTRRHRARRRRGTRCIMVDVNESDLEAFVARNYLSEETSHDPGAIKVAIEGVISDLVFELETERFSRSRPAKRVTAR
jgi:hypothetical protein